MRFVYLFTGLSSIKVNGFKEVYEEGTEKLTIKKMINVAVLSIADAALSIDKMALCVARDE